MESESRTRSRVGLVTLVLGAFSVLCFFILITESSRDSTSEVERRLIITHNMVRIGFAALFIGLSKLTKKKSFTAKVAILILYFISVIHTFFTVHTTSFGTLFASYLLSFVWFSIVLSAILLIPGIFTGRGMNMFSMLNLKLLEENSPDVLRNMNKSSRIMADIVRVYPEIFIRE
jgi:hypothetical protein